MLGLSHEGRSGNPCGHFLFMPAGPSDSRSPCPALNALANHGYISRDGRNISFTTMVSVLTQVYNIAYPLAVLLASFGYITCGRLSISPTSHTTSSQFDPRNPPCRSLLGSLFRKVVFTLGLRLHWTLDLRALQKRAFYCITHDASLVHCDSAPSCSPDRKLVSQLVAYSLKAHRQDPGLSLSDFARLHGQRTYEASASGHPLSVFHEQVSLGECALAWLVLRTRSPTTSPSRKPSLHVPTTRVRGGSSFNSRSIKEDCQCDSEEDPTDAVIPLSRVLQLFAEERLPDGWWDDPAKGGIRPPSAISFHQARSIAKYVGRVGLY